MNLLPYSTAHAESIANLQPDPGTTRTVDATVCWEGVSSLKVATTVALSGAYFSAAGFPISANSYYSGSASVRGSGTLEVTLKSYPSNTVVIKTVTLSSAWQRVECPGLFSGGSDNLIRFIFRFASGTGDFWVDGVQIEPGNVCNPFGQSPLGTPAEPIILLAELTAYTGSGTETLRYATSGVTVGGYYYEPRIINPGSMKNMLFSDGTTSGRSELGYGGVVLANADGGLDGLLNYGLDGRAIVIKRLVAGVAVLLMSCTMEQVTTPNLNEVAIRIKDPQSLLETPVQTNKYAGTNVLPDGVEGVDDIKGKEKPVLEGVVSNATPVCVNTSRLIYQCNDGTMQAIPAVYDKGVALTAGAAYSSLADMQANAPLPGQYRVYLAGGYFRLGSSPAGQVTFDGVVGATAADRTAAQVAKRLALRKLSSGDMITQDFTDLDTLNSAEVGIYINGPMKISEALDKVLAPGAWWAFDAEAKLNVGRLDEPSGTPALSLTSAEILSLERQVTNDQGRGVPAYRVDLNYQKSWTVQDAGGLAGSIVSRSWREVTPFPGSTYTGGSIAYGNGCFVAVGSVGGASIISRSFGGEDATSIVYPGNAVADVAYGNGVFVVTCPSANKVYTSPDGAAWTLRNANFPSMNIAFGNGVFVMTRIGGTVVAHSADGITWTNATTAATGPIAFGNGVFATTNGYASADGASWSAGTMPSASPGSWSAIASGNGRFVAVASGSALAATSSDGLSWTLRTLPESASWHDITFGEAFVAVASDLGSCITSNDGIAWDSSPILADNEGWTVVGFGNGKYVAHGYALYEKAAVLTLTPSAERAAFVAAEYRSVTATDPSILTAHLNAAVLSFDSLLVSPTAAQTEADRLLDLYSVRRDYIMVSCKRSALPAQLPVQGSVVEVTYPRYGYHAGKLFIFLGYEQHLGTDDVTLYLWG